MTFHRSLVAGHCFTLWKVTKTLNLANPRPKVGFWPRLRSAEKVEMVKQKKRTRITHSEKNCPTKSAIQDARLIWKQKIWLVLTKPHCLLANHNPEFRCVICNGGRVLHFLPCYNWTALPSANQNRVFFSCILLTILFRSPGQAISTTLISFLLSSSNVKSGLLALQWDLSFCAPNPIIFPSHLLSWM